VIGQNPPFAKGSFRRVDFSMTCQIGKPVQGRPIHNDGTSKTERRRTMDELQLHVAGATIRHLNPFSVIEVPTSEERLPNEIVERWVRPLYFGLQREDVDTFLLSNLSAADDQLVDLLLTHFDWRPRTAGAYLAALNGRKQFTERIGHLLLRSDVCYAGSAYCLALAAFNNPKGCDFLDQYLSYYLGRSDLWFDQGDAMAAVAYLDKLNGSNKLGQFLPQWEVFVTGKSGWNLQDSVTRFDGKMQHFHSLQRGIWSEGR
jgi:hypothetical protein